jgi:hypothetical protein
MKIICTLLLAFLSCNLYAQEIITQPRKPRIEVKKPSCEFNSLELNSLSQNTATSDLLIIVSHLGVSEKVKFGGRRLANAKTFLNLNNQELKRESDSIILTQGERVQGLGYLDFYVKGELELRIYVNKNKDLFLSDCVLNYPDEKPCTTKYSKLFYPCKGKK